MIQKLTAAGEWLRRRAENILCLMLFAMFVVFILQIVFRYLLNLSIGWTHEISVALWIWIVLFGSAFVIREQDEIRFDLIWGSAGNNTRRVMQILCAAALIFLFGVSLPAIYDYVSFMRVEKTAYLKIRFDWLYSIYGLFAVAVIVRQLWLGYQAIWGKPGPEIDVTRIKSGI